MNKEIGSTNEIIVRRMPFTFPEVINPILINGKIEMSCGFNGGSLLLPFLEPFLIRSMREAKPVPGELVLH